MEELNSVVGQNNNYSFSDKNESLTLGKRVQNKYLNDAEHTITNEDLDDNDIMKKAQRVLFSESIERHQNVASTAQKTLNKKVFDGEKDVNSERPLKTYFKFKESIDKGIEPGMSMASSGENLVRSSDKKGSRKLKEPPLEEAMNGGEMINSMAAQREDELKKVGDENELRDEPRKKGMTLSSFKKSKKVT